MTSTTHDPRLPDGFWTFFCPFPSETSPEADRLLAGTLAFARAYDLGGGDDAAATVLAHAGAGVLVHLLPHATGELAQALADYNSWAFRADDLAVPAPGTARTCDVVTRLARWTYLMRTPGAFPHGTPLDNAVSDAFRRLRRLMTPVQFDRFVTGQMLWVWSMLWETGQRERGDRLSVNDYLAMRRGSVGIDATPAFLDAVEGIEVPAREAAAPAVKAAVEAAMFVPALDDDRWSYHRELRPGMEKCNIFHALRHDDPGLSLHDAMREAITLRNRVLDLYLRLRGQILPQASPQLRRYFGAMERVISGAIVLGITNPRYVLPGTTRDARITDEAPTDLPTGPLPYPAVAWWWDHLDPGR
ncbi:terpene synthase family protein [Streptomyces huiliensis]|uniref:terpene synthase family protein n=1 Tax=Streptomyces huiliensis TaxID=2876027 RepID=UPI001CBF0447|nr:hypothetical protein [Streptomyces huiliensis]MBZ4318383.1 hypothetical protein [Streptomyces huiliensis]